MLIKDPQWASFLQESIQRHQVDSIIDTLKSSEQTFYPKEELIFAAFDHSPFDQTNVIILGQDPYHNPGEAMGLSFSVPLTKKVPPSLKNIFKEINTDLGIPIPSHGDLRYWAKQGVLLLNAMLTVGHQSPGSHRQIGWQAFTDQVIQDLSLHKSNLVFLLWGNYAQSKAALIDEKKHLILSAKHPSPLARGGFFGCNHFSQTNEFLIKNGKKPIDWSLPELKLF